MFWCNSLVACADRPVRVVGILKGFINLPAIPDAQPHTVVAVVRYVCVEYPPVFHSIRPKAVNTISMVQKLVLV